MISYSIIFQTRILMDSEKKKLFKSILSLIVDLTFRRELFETVFMFYDLSKISRLKGTLKYMYYFIV